MVEKMNTPETYGENLNQAQKFAVVLICPAGYLHSLALLEIAETIHFALVNLGFDSILTDSYESPDRKNIILGGHLLVNAPEYIIPNDAIIYNFEQIDPLSPWLEINYLKLLKSHEVWDYSKLNITALEKLGVKKLIHLPLGYVHQLNRIKLSNHPDIDVLFYGSLNDRRSKIIDDLKAANLNVVNVFGVYGAERDALISRSKIVLNIHFYESKIFEIARISYLLSNGVCVVSESGNDPIESEFKNALVLTEYDNIVSTCISLINDGNTRKSIAEIGRNYFNQLRQEVFLKKALLNQNSFEQIPIRIVCATKSSIENFANTYTGISLNSFCKTSKFELRIFAENTRGLSEIYNIAIDESINDPAILIFMHDDVLISDFFWATRITNSLNNFDVVGVVGNTKRISNQPGWIMLSLDGAIADKSLLSGSIGQGNSFPPNQLDYFGPSGRECKLMDGVFLAASSETLIKNKLRFDPKFKFHFYDMDFCRSTEKAGLKMGTVDISLLHQSYGQLTSEWMESYQLYLEKWGD